jgi:hypothetical protein
LVRGVRVAFVEEVALAEGPGLVVDVGFDGVVADVDSAEPKKKKKKKKT